MVRKPTAADLDSVGRAISTLVQQRYVWLFSHISRAVFLEMLDEGRLAEFPDIYFFSEEDASGGADPIRVQDVTHGLTVGIGESGQAVGPDGTSYDQTFVRNITLTGIRGSLLVSVQSYLEYFGIEGLIRRYSPRWRELFVFIRQSRNIICHSNGLMVGQWLRSCTWRGITITKGGGLLELTDQSILHLADDAIEALARLHVDNGRQLDAVSLSLGCGVPYIRQLAEGAGEGDQ